MQSLSWNEFRPWIKPRAATRRLATSEVWGLQVMEADVHTTVLTVGPMYPHVLLRAVLPRARHSHDPCSSFHLAGGETTRQII